MTLEGSRRRDGALPAGDEGTREARAGGVGRHTRALRRAMNRVGTGDEVARSAHITSWDRSREHLGEATDQLGAASSDLGRATRGAGSVS
jgi:hypothetical protein